MSEKNVALWGGRFEGAPEEALQAFGASLPVDRRLWEQDIAGSRAHAHMLAKQGIISSEDAAAIDAGLGTIAAALEAGEFEFSLADEDIHMSIERALTKLVGDAGRRLHTARSRNDQVATDTRLYVRQQAQALARQLLDVRGTLIRLAQDNAAVIMPGYTHLQKAQPVLFAHHMLAYSWMLTRDFSRMLAARDAADSSPLGAAALAGTGHPLDRAQTAAELGFASVIPNSLDAVSDRDFLLDLIYACTVTMVHLSRLCEELILWSSDEFGFITLSDALSTGSSIMPQKKNPDFAELVRGKTGRVIGDLVGLLTVLKGLPLAYNKDLQEDKEGAFDAIDTLRLSLVAVEGMLATMTVNAEAMRAGAQGGFMAATDLADFLAARGVPFRDAHEVVGRLVLVAEKSGRTLEELTLEELRTASPVFDEEALEALKIENVVARRTSTGGTAPVRVAEQLALAVESLEADKNLLSVR
ncbi:MAG: argininosuccinate lyase [Coriobacteriales bacterium]|jgi:argininosuccinate lyase|nr:argininosuccinate lyase [Coriobacteriales bacterium]